MKQTFATPGRVALDVRLPEGWIDLGTSESEETVVELTGPPEEELAERARIECRDRDGSYEVVVRVEENRGFGIRFLAKTSYRLDVRLPHGADARVATGSADVRARGRYGAVDVQTGSGDIEFERVDDRAQVKSGSGDVSLGDVGGEASISTASGDIEIARLAASAKLRSASGDVVVREAEAGVTVQTASGDQSLGSVAQGQVTLQSASGDLQVGVRRGSRLWVDAKSMSGETTSELELDDVPPDGEEGPLVELRATAMSGDIRVVRA